MREQVVRVQRRVEADEADVRRGILLARPVGDADAQAQGGMHGDGDRDQPGPAYALGIEWLDGNVEHGRPVAGALEESGRPRHGQRLVP